MSHDPDFARVSLSEHARSGLDAARACSAIYVVLHHTSKALPMPHPLELALSFGQEAVIVFFLLSGFVIFANEAYRVSDLPGYYLRRLRRLYPLIVLAMLVSTLVWSIGYISAQPSWGSFLATLFSVQDIGFLKPGVVASPFLGNDPLWSLSYEAFFYAVFPVVAWAFRRRPSLTRWLLGAISLLAYASYLAWPNHFSLVAAYFLSWWAGAVAAHLFLGPGLTISGLRLELGFLTALTALAAVPIAMHQYAGPGVFPVLMVRHFAVADVLTFLLATPVRSLLGRTAYVWRTGWAWVASISYGIYVFHYPILIQPSSRLGWAVWIPLALLVVVVAWVAERKLMPLIPKPRRRRAMGTVIVDA